MLYSFGIKGSLNIEIPLKISEELGYKYEPIYLEKEYEEVYNQFAEEAVIQSDCLRTIESANYPFAFKQLSKFSDVVITGIFGSELLRTFQNVGLMVKKEFVDLNNSNNSENTWNNIKNNLLTNSYLDKQLIENNFEEVKNHFNEVIWSNIKELTTNQRFYIYLISAGLKNYFGGEVHSERIYATNRFPYLDEDFVKFIFQSPFAGIYSTALNPTANQRFRSQYFYAKIIEMNKPELLKYQTDHGFPADYVLSKFPLLKISLPYFINRRKKKRTRYVEFKPVDWGEKYFNNTDLNLFLRSSYLNEKYKGDYITGRWKNNYSAFFKHASFNIWMNIS